MEQQVEYENRLDVGGLSTESEDLILRAWEYRESRSCLDPYPYAKFMLKATPGSLGILCDSAVKFYRRKVGEESWGIPLFNGYVITPHPLRDNDIVRVTCKGIMGRLRQREVRDYTIEAPGPTPLHSFLTSWASQYASDYYDTPDIDVTEPVAFPDEITVKRGKQLDFLKAVRRFAPIYISLDMDSSSNQILTIRDEVHPTQAVWDAMTEYERGVRQFGPKTKIKRNVDFSTPHIYPKLEGNWRGLDVVQEGDPETVIGSAGEIADLFVYTNGLSGDPEAYAQLAWDDVRITRRCGWIELSGIEQTAEHGPYRDPNQLLRLLPNKRGTEGIYAVQRIWWAQRYDIKRKRWEPATTTLVLADRVHKTYVPTAMPGGPDATARKSSPYAGEYTDQQRDLINNPNPVGLSY